MQCYSWVEVSLGAVVVVRVLCELLPEEHIDHHEAKAPPPIKANVYRWARDKNN